MDHAKQIDDLAEALASTESELRDAREALARVEAERDYCKRVAGHNKALGERFTAERDTAQAQLAEAVGLLRSAEHQLLSFYREHNSQWCGYLDDALGVIQHIIGSNAGAGQQEAQGAQAGDAHQGKYWAFRNEDGELCITDRWDVAKHIPFDVITLVERAAPPAAAPVAAGEPIQVEAVAVTREDEDGLYLDWVLEGGISALEAPGVVLLVAHGTVTDGQGSGEVYLAPPAAAHGDEAVRKDAERYRWLRNQCGERFYVDLICLPGAIVDHRIDAAMRAQGDGEVQ